MRTFDNLAEVLESDIPKNIKEYIKEFTECADASYTDMYGGTVNVVEDFEDLEDITVFNLDVKGELSLANAVGTFDVFDKHEGFYEICNVTTNSGGNSYYIPDHLATENVRKSYALTNDLGE